MARHDDAPLLSEMLAGETGEGIKDLLREVVRDALQELIEEELTSTIGAAKHERTESRTAHRNGSRDRLVSTPAGDVELKIPKLRKGSFFPELLEPHRRIDRVLWAVIMNAYITGTSGPASLSEEPTFGCRAATERLGANHSVDRRPGRLSTSSVGIIELIKRVEDLNVEIMSAIENCPLFCRRSPRSPIPKLQVV